MSNHEQYKTPAPAVVGLPVERQVRPLAYVPRAIEDGEFWVSGELRLVEIDERPFKCNKGWECAALYDQAALDAATAAERERYAPLMRAVEWLLDDGHMNQEHLDREQVAALILHLKNWLDNDSFAGPNAKLT